LQILSIYFVWINGTVENGSKPISVVMEFIVVVIKIDGKQK